MGFLKQVIGFLILLFVAMILVSNTLNGSSGANNTTQDDNVCYYD
jgi:hypothetical protein